MIHEIKLREDFCTPVLKGKKTFEVRKNDRDYRVGDYIRFKPIDFYLFSTYHKIQLELFEITYVLGHRDFAGIGEGYVVLAIKKVSEKRRKEIEEAEKDGE